MENCWNQRKRTGKSKYKGVQWSNTSHKWKVQVSANGESTYGGVFVSERDAALKANALMLEKHGKFAKLNEVDNV
jgi:hypothetical protein